LAQRCRSRGTRTAEFTKQAPTKFAPASLRDPRSPADCFTQESAWLFMAEQIDAGIEIEIIDLDFPIGKKGYVMRVPGCPPVKRIYIKLQLLSKHVLCRSFHESDR
jgi:hypothetical protein